MTIPQNYIGILIQEGTQYNLYDWMQPSLKIERTEEEISEILHHHLPHQKHIDRSSVKYNHLESRDSSFKSAPIGNV